MVGGWQQQAAFVRIVTCSLSWLIRSQPHSRNSSVLGHVFSLSKFWWHSCVNDDALKRCASPDTEQSLKHFPYGSMNGHALVTVLSDVLVVLQKLWHGTSCTWQIWRNMMGTHSFVVLPKNRGIQGKLLPSGDL